MHHFENEDLQIGLDGSVVPPARFEVLESLLASQYEFVGHPTDVRRFRSRKNVVFSFRVGTDQLVAKLFVTDFFKKELEQLLMSARNGITVPTVLTAENGVILMSYVPGRPLVDVLNETFSMQITRHLAEWYNKYHHVAGRVKGDPRLRNFLFDDDCIFGLDFEESAPGEWIEDIGGVAASLLDTDPIGDSRKYPLVWNLFETYLSLENLESTSYMETEYFSTIAKYLERTALWRKSEELLTLARKVRASGIPKEKSHFPKS